MHLVLASASPRRAELLTLAGFSYEVRPADVDETPHAAETAEAYAMRVALEKASLVAGRQRRRAALVLAADTVVVTGRGQILGKPVDAGEARAMLRSLSGDIHKVHTGVVLHTADEVLAELVTTRVRFIDLSDSEIEWYVATGEPHGKAGAYAIQGRASRFIDWIEGSWSNVVGLPVASVYRMLSRAGVLS